MRRLVNRKCLQKSDEWVCDGTQLCEKADWDQVWGRDGVHLRKVKFTAVDGDDHRTVNKDQRQGKSRKQ